jgi:hypothetical protein
MGLGGALEENDGGAVPACFYGGAEYVDAIADGEGVVEKGGKGLCVGDVMEEEEKGDGLDVADGVLGELGVVVFVVVVL